MKFNRSLLALIAISAGLFLSGCTQIDTGNVGVERALGKVNPVAQGPGVYVTVFDSVDEFTTKEVSFAVNNLSPKSSDNLTLQDLDVDVYYKVDAASIPGLFVKYQGDVVRHHEIVENGSNVNVIGYGRVLRAAREAVYDAVDDFPATTMHTKRSELAEAIRINLQRELEKSDKGVFTITTVNVRNLLTDKAIERAIQNQVRLDQDILAKQKQVLLAKEEANRLREQAQGEADANAILAASLTPSVMQLRLAEINRTTIIASAKAGNTIITGDVTPLITTK